MRVDTYTAEAWNCSQNLVSEMLGLVDRFVAAVEIEIYKKLPKLVNKVTEQRARGVSRGMRWLPTAIMH
jgi:hypothetical protein